MTEKGSVCYAFNKKIKLWQKYLQLWKLYEILPFGQKVATLIMPFRFALYPGGTTISPCIIGSPRSVFSGFISVSMSCKEK